MGELQASILTALSQRYGQLFCYPDTGEPAIVYPTRLEPASLVAFYEEVVGSEDGWQVVCERLYGQ
jgi:hypothetical protein